MPKQKAGKSTSKRKPVKGNNTPLKPTTVIFSWLCVPLALGISYYYYVYVYQTSLVAPVIDPLYDPDILRDRTIFEVQDLPGKGKGVIAIRNIKQGELIIREKPAILIPTSINTNPETFIASHLSTLSPSLQSAFFNLSFVNLPSHLNPESSDEKTRNAIALAIVQTNSVAAGGDNVGVFPRMARLNHGCAGAFNVVYSWREEEGSLVVHALKDVKEGEELLTVYMDTKKPRSERRPYLEAHYGFTCTCAICSLPPPLQEQSDQRLKSIAFHYASFSTWAQQSISGKEAIEHVRTVWNLEDEEGYFSERGTLAADAAWVAAAHHDEDATRSWATVAEKWFAIELGEDSENARLSRKVMQDPRFHHAWATRKAEVVGGPMNIIW